MLYGVLRVLALVATGAGLIAALVFAVQNPDAPIAARSFMVGWLAVSMLSVVFLGRVSKLSAELFGLFALLVGWRVSALSGADLTMYILGVAFLCYLAGFFRTAFQALSGHGSPNGTLSSMGPTEWHLTFLRLYVGLDFVPHFTEKLFAGPVPHNADVTAFRALELGDLSGPLVWIGGLCELGAAVGIGLGLFTRFAAIGTTLYLLVATIIGRHFQMGFIWASEGGGWEYPLLWMVIVLSFAYYGAGNYSLDGAIRSKVNLPAWLGWLMGRQHNNPNF